MNHVNCDILSGDTGGLILAAHSQGIDDDHTDVCQTLPRIIRLGVTQRTGVNMAASEQLLAFMILVAVVVTAISPIVLLALWVNNWIRGQIW